ncbi:uncharacterized protein EDB91DRAFT_1076846 [Suillus paluster]|uniref:uncharacterized protein n=1 Tax=Suillus paluster TaxID=48578 RepID=UPI001B86E37F|nr:uncharacterized protein EDB91DRAFT_1076846 [Suillus paluster]KAG1754740.1 hypothetical protein EDB91DRAFT_1076846 [Suillus paluster]
MSPGGAQPSQPNSSSTPPHPNVPAQAVSSIKTTPNSRGAATVSEHIGLVGTRVNQVRPWVQRDIEKAERCHIDKMLEVLLQRASLDPKTEQPDLLGRCLQAILSVCNWTATPAGKAPDKDFHSSCIKDALDKYVLKGVEEDYYEPFITATNIALACLDNIKIEGMRATSGKPDIVLQMNDIEMTQSHQNTTLQQRPDVVILPLQSSLDAFQDGDIFGDAEHILKNTIKEPKAKLLWKNVLALIEFKRKMKKYLRVPSSYDVKSYVPTKPEYLGVETPATDAPKTPASGPLQTQAEQPKAAPPTICRSNCLIAQSPATTSNSSSKRKAEEPLQCTGKRTKTGETEPKLDVTVQTGLYAAEMFAANIAVKHLLNLIIIEVEQGGSHTLKSDDKEGSSQMLEVDGVDLLFHTSDKARVTHYRLKGRATNVVPVTSEYLAKKYPEVQKDGMVAKIFWAEEGRTSEPEILKKVEEIAKTKKVVEGHTPHLLWHHEFKNPTSAIQEALGVPEYKKGSRMLYVLVFRRLQPITNLEGERLFDVWHQCILCHLALWKGGVHHRDVSPPNMMFYETDKGILMGVLNNFDLSLLATTKGPLGNERTGTVPFMALNLLTEEGLRGEVEHLYHHDLESFMWVLVWVCLHYRKGVLLPPKTRPLDAWATTEAKACGKKKYYFIGRISRYRTVDIDSRMWDLVLDCLNILDMDTYNRQQQLRLGVDNAQESEADMDEFLHRFTSTKSWISLTEDLPRTQFHLLFFFVNHPDSLVLRPGSVFIATQHVTYNACNFLFDMAHTRRTKIKSTGGPAKHGVLPGSLRHVPVHNGKVLIESVYPNMLPSGLSKTITSGIKGPLKPQHWNIWCLLCRDGAPQMYECSFCPRTICERCLAIPEESWEYINSDDIFFRCPGCHEVRNKWDRKGIITLYSGFEDAEGKPALARPVTIHGHIELTSRSEVCTMPVLVLILNFVLDGVDVLGSPAHIMRDALHPYVAADYHEIIFDVRTVSKAKNHAKLMTKLANELGSCCYDRVKVFVHSHSETTRGDLWGGFKNSKNKGERGEPVAYAINDFFALVFVNGMENFLQGSTLWMLVCSHMVRKVDAFDNFKACTKSYEVQHAFAFGAEHFHACLITAFNIAYVSRVLVEGFEVQDTMQDLLVASFQLGMHSSVIHVHITNAFRRRPPTVSEYNKGALYVDEKASMITSMYTYFNENQRPWGNPLPYQCSDCNCVRPWNRSTRSMSDDVKFSCKNCSFILTYTKPDQTKIILFTDGYQGTSNASGKLTKKGCGTGCGWLVLVANEPGVPAVAQSRTHAAADH